MRAASCTSDVLSTAMATVRSSTKDWSSRAIVQSCSDERRGTGWGHSPLYMLKLFLRPITRVIIDSGENLIKHVRGENCPRAGARDRLKK
eukprot:2297588-Pyramimonas_sp.AAC.1